MPTQASRELSLCGDARHRMIANAGGEQMTGKDRQVILCKDYFGSKPRCYICDGRLAILCQKPACSMTPRSHPTVISSLILRTLSICQACAAFRGSRLPADRGFPHIPASRGSRLPPIWWLHLISPDAGYLGNDHWMTQVRAQTKGRPSLRSVLQEDQRSVSRAKLLARKCP